MDYKISIILPIFNVEQYLKAALDSIINQTFNIDDIEVLMINDCSTDGSGEIIDEYAKKFDNFIAIHLDKNSGTAGKPRNVGLDNSSGEYIMFLDSDDELMEDVCETLYTKLIETESDIVTGNAICIQKDNELIDISYSKSYYEFNPNKNLELFKPFRLWGTLYKKSLIKDNNLRFIYAATNDDTHFVYNSYFHANKIVYINDYIGVKYYERDDSLTHEFSKKNLVTTIDAFKQILILISEVNPSKDYIYDPFILNIFVRFNNKWAISSNEKKEVFKKILDYENYSKYIFKLPIHFRIMNFLLIHKCFNALIIVHSIFLVIMKSRFSKNLLLKSRETPVDK